MPCGNVLALEWSMHSLLIRSYVWHAAHIMICSCTCSLQVRVEATVAAFACVASSSDQTLLDPAQPAGAIK